MAKAFIDLFINLLIDVKINVICIRELSTKIGMIWFLEYNMVRKINLRPGTSHIHCVNVITSCIVLQYKSAGTFYVPVDTQLRFKLKMQPLAVVVRSQGSHNIAMFHWDKGHQASCGMSIRDNLSPQYQ